MCVPGRARTGFEGDAGARRAGWSFRVEQRVDAHGADEPIGRTFDGSLSTTSFDFDFGVLSFTCSRLSGKNHWHRERRGGTSFHKGAAREHVRHSRDVYGFTIILIDSR